MFVASLLYTLSFEKLFWGQKKIEISSISFVLKQPLIHAVGRSRWAHNNDNATKKTHACYFWYWCRHMLLWLKTEPDKEVTFLSSLILYFLIPKIWFWLVMFDISLNLPKYFLHLKSYDIIAKCTLKVIFLRCTNNFISLAFLLWSCCCCCCCCCFFLLQNHLWKMSLPIYLCRAKNKNPFSQIFFFVCCRCDDKTFSLKDMNGLIFDSKLFFWIFFSRERMRFTSGPPKALAAYANA